MAEVDSSTLLVKNFRDSSDRGRLALLQMGSGLIAMISSNQRDRFEDMRTLTSENRTPTPITLMSLDNLDIGKLTKVQTPAFNAGIAKVSRGVIKLSES